MLLTLLAVSFQSVVSILPWARKLEVLGGPDEHPQECPADAAGAVDLPEAAGRLWERLERPASAGIDRDYAASMRGSRRRTTDLSVLTQPRSTCEGRPSSWDVRLRWNHSTICRITPRPSTRATSSPRTRTHSLTSPLAAKLTRKARR